MTNESFFYGCGIEMYCISDQCLTAVITTKSDDRDKNTVLIHNQQCFVCFFKNNVKITYMDIKYNLKKYNTLNK